MMGGKWAQMWENKHPGLVESFILFHFQRTVDCIFTQGGKLSFLSVMCHILTMCAVLDCFVLM